MVPYISPIARFHRSNQGVEKGIALLTITSSDTLEKSLLPVPVILSNAGLYIWVSEWGVLEAQTSSLPLWTSVMLKPTG